MPWIPNAHMRMAQSQIIGIDDCQHLKSELLYNKFTKENFSNFQTMYILKIIYIFLPTRLHSNPILITLEPNVVHHQI